MLTNVDEATKPPVFLLDTMSFIFRAYHAMQRSRPMSTRSGLPTAATYVFVNMIRKLRQDFTPKYFAAVFDPSGQRVLVAGADGFLGDEGHALGSNLSAAPFIQ